MCPGMKAEQYMAGGVVHLWNEWALQVLVLLSFSLQAFLLVFAGIRRRNASTVLRVFLWLAYLLADSTATYTIGHLSIASSSSSSSRVHQLIAFWAPFLLLHLGGQDTITAYALEDNRLWLRHLQTLLVQVLGAAYVLYRYIFGSGALVPAAVLMFAVGVIKYGERIWALKCADEDGINRFLDNHCEETYDVLSYDDGTHRMPSYDDAMHDLKGFGTEEVAVMHGAHILLGVCVRLFLDHDQRTSLYECGVIAYFVGNKNIYRVIEMELSLMYDIMYTKARVIHTWYGRCIRVVLLLAIVAALLLFQFVSKVGYNRVDVAITYILLVGAFLMEMTSGFMAIGSTWTRHTLYMWRTWNWLLPVIVPLRRLVRAESLRSWSGTIGQFNMLDYCSGHISVSSNLYKVKIALPPPVQVSTHIKDLMLSEILRIAERHGGTEDRMNSLNQNNELPVFDADFDTRIIIWHIATGVILCTASFSSNDDGDGNHRIEAIKTLSDYMMFLLAKHPEMLPGPRRHPVYAGALVWLNSINVLTVGSSVLPRVQLARNLLKEGREPDNPYGRDKSPCKIGAELAISLLGKGWEPSRLQEVMFGVWVELLCYAGSHCSRDSHARKLSSGGEFVSVVWLLTIHLAEYERYKRRN